VSNNFQSTYQKFNNQKGGNMIRAKP